MEEDIVPNLDVAVHIWKTLHIPKHHTKCLSRERAVCLVPEDWLLNLKQKKLQNSSQFYKLESAEADQFLAASCSHLPRPWQRVSVKVILKEELVVPRLGECPLYKARSAESVLEHLTQTARQNFNNLWASAHLKYYGTGGASNCEEKDEWSRVIKRFLQKLKPGVYICLWDGYELPEQNNTTDNERFDGSSIYHNIVPIIAVIETESRFFVVQPYIESKLKTVVSYSPAILSSSYAKALFILYQILQAMKTFHELGLSVGDLNIDSILLDKNLWVYLPIPRLKSLHSSERPEKLDIDPSNVMSVAQDGGINLHSSDFTDGSSLVKAAQVCIQNCRYMQYSFGHLSDLMDDWVQRRLSNFKYLIILNHLAGRRMGDPNHHPVVPWVTNFVSPNEGFRDLKMSKFRINKGDSQLDFTYEVVSSSVEDPGNIAHHVSDVLSDITYYVYKARQTPKSILCHHVRSKWVPNEYPLSMQRMQEWTPDECIPEFFTDPSIFTSIHEDLPDLELPSWCMNAEDFICKHMEIMESDHVSKMLHHWIDLTFGYKLSGSAAVKSKNIYLQLVDNHKTLTSHGVIQLFSQPHPHRLPWGNMPSHHPVRVPRNILQTQQSSSQSTEALRPEQATIILPADYNPIAFLEHQEALGNFSSKTLKDLPPSVKSKKDTRPSEMDLVARDMQVFGCLMCEMFLASKLHMQSPSASLTQRYRILQSLAASEKSEMPRCIQKAAEKLLKLDAKSNTGKQTLFSLFEYDIVDSGGHPPPSPVFFLQPMVDILPFPSYFSELYKCLCFLKQKDADIDQIFVTTARIQERNKIIKILAREKVKFLEEFLARFRGQFGTEGIELLLPYIEELFDNPDTSVQAAWYLFTLISSELGPRESAKRFIPHLVSILGGENMTPKHLKLYHHTFIIQLMIRLGLNTFLANFSTLLVEATAGYRDFPINKFSDDTQENYETETETEISERSHDTEKSLQSLQEELKTERNWMETIGQDVSDNMESNGNSNMDDDPGDNFSLEDEDVVQRKGTEDTGSIGHFSSKSNQSDESLSDLDTDEDSSAFEVASQSSASSLSQYIENTPLELAMSTDFNAENDSSDTKDRLESTSSYSEISSVGDGNASFSLGLIRSETDEFNQTMSDTGAVSTMNIRDVAAESIKWLAHKLGPVLAAKYMSRNLLRMLALCYLGEEQLMVVSDLKHLKTSRLICGDDNSQLVLDCLHFITVLYGEHTILLQYIPSIIDIVSVAKRRLTQRAEAGLLGSIVLLKSIIPMISEKTLMEILQDTIIGEILKPVIELVASLTVGFPSGTQIRTALCYKIIDVMYTLGLRLGFEMTRTYMTEILRCFFSAFDTVHGNHPTPQPPPPNSIQQSSKWEKSKFLDSDDAYCNIKIDDNTNEYTVGSPVVLNIPYSPKSSSSHKSVKSPYSLSPNSLADERDEPDETNPSKEHAQQELAEVFKPELALAAYIPLCRIFGSIHMEQCLKNDDLIRQLCAEQDSAMDRASSSSDPTSPSGDSLSSPDSEDSHVSSPKGISSNIDMVGNRINFPCSPDMMQFGRSYKHSKILSMHPDETRNTEMEHGKQRHLRGDWLAYWEHELGLSERDILFNFKQIKLQTFVGHTNSIRCLVSMDNENSFISGSKDKSVRLWSIRSYGDGTGKCGCQWTYHQHKKSILSVAYLENLRRVASCDSTVHIWDPFTGDLIQRLESSKYSPVIVLSTIPAPSPIVVAATTDSTLRFLDLRAASYAHEYRCTTTSTGLVRSVAVSPDSRWIAVGFSSGFITLLDVNSRHIKAYNKNSLISTSFDQTVKLWNVEDGKDLCSFKGQTDPVHCVNFYRDQIITGTTGNKIGVYTSVDRQAGFTGTKLKNDTFKGVLTTMAVLPLNRSLLLGADNGTIRLFC
ncbi:hypothetical protein ScPMuIL_014345 [Solemya velum]